MADAVDFISPSLGELFSSLRIITQLSFASNFFKQLDYRMQKNLTLNVYG